MREIFGYFLVVVSTVVFTRALAFPKVAPAAPASVSPWEPYEGTAFCVTCKHNVEFVGVVKLSDSGRRMAQGRCPSCSTKVNRILGKL